MNYTVKREVPDTLELMTAVSSARYTVELVSRSFSDEICTLPDVLGEVDKYAKKRLQALNESLVTVVMALEKIQEMTEALDGAACTEKHLATIKHILETPKEKRTALEEYAVYQNRIDERPEETPQQTFERYRAEVEKKGFSPVELW